MAVAIESKECGAETQQGKVALDEIKAEWMIFIASTVRLSPGSPQYKEAKQLMTRNLRGIKNRVPEDCWQKLTSDSQGQTALERRSPLDVTLDELVFNLARIFPGHPELKTWGVGRAYWGEFLESQRSSLAN